MDIFQMFMNYTPDVYVGEENTRKLLKTWSDLFETVIANVDNLPNYYYIDTAPEEWLELLGSNIGRDRISGEDLEVYRSIVQIKYFNSFLIPTHDNLLRVTKKTSGLYPYLKPLWELEGTDFPSQPAGEQTDLAYYVSYDIPLDYPQEILDELENLYPAGVKLVRDFLFKLESKTIKVGSTLYYSRVLSRGYIEEGI